MSVLGASVSVSYCSVTDNSPTWWLESKRSVVCGRAAL